MVDYKGQRALDININERKLSIIVHSLFSSWLLAFLFEGQILYAIAGQYDLAPRSMVFEAIAALCVGMLICGFLIKKKKAARGLFLFSYIFFIAASAAFFFPPSVIWTIGIVASSFFAGGCVAAWGFYFKSGTPKNERIKTAADVLIYSNVLMILLNMAAIHLSPHVGLALSMLIFLGAFVFALRFPSIMTILRFRREEEKSQSPAAFALLLLLLYKPSPSSGCSGYILPLVIQMAAELVLGRSLHRRHLFHEKPAPQNKPHVYTLCRHHDDRFFLYCLYAAGSLGFQLSCGEYLNARSLWNL